MNIIVLYATNSGGTFMAAQTVADVLKKAGNQVDLKNVNEADQNGLAKYDLVAIGSPSYDYNGKEGQPHEEMVNFLNKLAKETIENKKFAVFGLGDSSYIEFCGAVKEIEKKITELGGKLVTDSLKIDGFFFQQDQNTQKINEWAKNLTPNLEKNL
ncbi:flavodoxin domain-containing protein [Candidatus Gottesmanbacteria bacterium]|nr:flavodoxin domain-containing protein [Candidatus Gottesmanbacteria bacterium]